MPKKIAVRLVSPKLIVEAQEQLPNGEWAPAKVVAIAGPKLKKAEGEFLDQPVIPPVTDTNIQAVRDARNALSQKAWQDYVLRRNYYRIFLAARGGWVDWRVNLPEVSPEQGKVPFWFHDDVTMKVGGTYRYRVQVAFLNPGLLSEEAFGRKHLKDARVISVLSPKGEWSEPVTVPRDVRFYLSGASETMKQVTVTVFTWKWGQRVMKTFNLKPGQPIGGKAMVDLIDPLGQPGERRSVEVDFTTGAVALRFNFQKFIYRPFKVRTAEMVYLTGDGKVKSRIQALDDGDEVRQKLLAEVKQLLGGR
jgi:hypothetical protein